MARYEIVYAALLNATPTRVCGCVCLGGGSEVGVA